MTDQFLKLSEVQKSYNLTRHTLASFEEQGALHPIRTSGGQRRYLKSELDNLAKATAFGSSFIVPPTEDFENPNPRSRDTYDELGVTGLAHFGGAVAEERLRELRGTAGRERYREMAQNDPVIAAVLFAIGHALKQPEHRVQPASDKESDKAAAEFIGQCLDDMSFSWMDTKTFIISPMLEQGVSLLELVYKKRLGDTPPSYDKEKNPASSKFNDGRIGWRKWSPRPVESLVPGAEWIFDEHGGVNGINQMDYYGTGKTFSIPIAKLLHFRSTVHPANTPEPPPVTRPAYVPYIYTKNFQEIEGIGIERDLQGLPVMYLGSDATSLYDTAKGVVTNVRVDEQMGLVIPYAKMGEGAAEGRGVLFELVSSNNSRAHDISAVIDRYDKRKALVTLTQFIFLGMQEVGSYALSRTQGDLFMLAASAWLKGIADIINRHAIPRLMALNSFPGITGMPELVFNPMGVPSLAEVADYINKLVDKEVITPDFEMEKTLRKLAELPDPDDTVEDRWKKKTEMALNPPTPPPALPTAQPNGFRQPQLEKVAKAKGLTEQGREAHKLTEYAGQDIAKEWARMSEAIVSGTAASSALAKYKRNVTKILKNSYQDAWELGREGDFVPDEASEINKAMGDTTEYLDDFLEELNVALNNIKVPELKKEKLEGGLSRALLYAGSVWALYNVAKTFKKSPESLWKWVGINDSRACQGCKTEMAAGVRPLSKIDKRPGQNECISNCRCELVQVR